MKLTGLLVLTFLAHCGQARQGKAYGALGLSHSNYKATGTNITLGQDLLVYLALPGQPGSGEKVIIWAHDSYGPSSGRTYELVDQLAAETEYTVLLPDFFRGEQLPDYDKYTWASNLQPDWEDLLRPFIENTLGGTAVGAVGTCWGSYFSVHVSTDSLVKAGFAPHPFHPECMAINGESEVGVYNNINEVGGAQYFFPTPGDPGTTRPGGLADETLNTLLIEEQFLPCIHGYFNRGDLDNPEVKSCVDFTYAEMINFFREYL